MGGGKLVRVAPKEQAEHSVSGGWTRDNRTAVTGESDESIPDGFPDSRPRSDNRILNRTPRRAVPSR